MDRPRLITRRNLLGLGAAAASGLILPGCTRGRADEPAPAGPAILATGNQGGVYWDYGSGLAEMVSQVTGVKLTAAATPGSVKNLHLLDTGKVDMAFSLADSALDAYEGVRGFKGGRLQFTALARMYDNHVHVVVPIKSKISKLSQLNGKIVNVGEDGSGTQVVARRLLREEGVQVSERKLSLTDAIAALVKRADNASAADGVDALIWSGGVPTEPLGVLHQKLGIQLIDIGDVAERIAFKLYGGYTVSGIPPSSYGLGAPVNTLAVSNYLLAKPNLSDAWAWWTLNTMFRRQNELVATVHKQAGALDVRSAIATTPIPLHPAAERWYRVNHV